MKPSRKAEVRRARHARLHSVTMGVDLSGLDTLLEELGDAAEQAARPASQAAAQVFYDRMRSNVARIGSVSGNLAQSIYQVYSKDQSEAGRSVYHISWNASEAPHGGLVEYGHWQRYLARMTPDGWRTVVRAEMQGKPKPKRRASQAEKDAYYVLRPGGPVYIPGKAFARGALDAAAVATHAAREVLLAALEQVE